MTMRAKVWVSLKNTVLDPQGQTIHAALAGLGYNGVNGVRQGKYFELTLADGLSTEAARAEVDRLARDVLTNPVIEEYSFQIENASE
jgi:phosphoribosylformylglycinamidine synthase PurS subunit